MNKHSNSECKNQNLFRKNVCIHCGKRFTKTKLLFRHQATHNNLKKFKCSDCQKLFKTKSSLQRHQLHTHKGIRKHKCNKCEASFSQKVNLMRHIKRLHSSCLKNRKYCNGLSKTEPLQEEAVGDDPNELAQLVLGQLKSLEMEFSSHLNTAFKAEDKPNKETSYTEAAKETQAALSKEETKTKSVKDTNSPKENMSFICEYCAKMFKKFCSLKRHLRIHSNERPFSCSNCSKSFRTKSKLREHFKRMHILDERTGILSNNHECFICNKIFDSIRQLDAHMRLHMSDYNIEYKCSTCKVKFNTMTAFSTHKHDNNDVVLSMLEKLIPEPFALKNRSHLIILNSKCPSCGLLLKDEGALQKHIVRHDMAKKLKCNTCGRSFVSKLSLRVHLKTHSVIKALTCNICQSKHFATASQLQRHKIHVHENIREIKCAYCPKMFKSKANCKSHMRTHIKNLLDTKETDMNLPKSALRGTAIIKTCGMQPTKENFIEIEVFPKNLQHKYQNIKIDMDNGCGTQSMSPIKSQHACEYCMKYFKKLNDLSRHLLTHTGDRPFKCETCNKCFRLKSTLEDHKKTHQNILERNQATCQVCGKSYASFKSLAVHLRIHTGALPFKCDNCGKAFRTSGHRLSHMRAAKAKNGQCKKTKSISHMVFLSGL